jgi:hypothetical protein
VAGKLRCMRENDERREITEVEAGETGAEASKSAACAQDDNEELSGAFNSSRFVLHFVE